MKKYVAEVVSAGQRDSLALRRAYVEHLNGEDTVAGRLRPDGGTLVSTTPLTIDGVTSALLVTWEVDATEVASDAEPAP
jgi:hypothetical protein